MSDRIEVKTKAAAEKAIKAGKPILILASISLTVSVDADIHVANGICPTVEAWGSSQPYVVARESSQPYVVARESSQPRVVAWGSSQPRVEARESSQPTVEAWENSQPTVEAWENSQPYVVARESSQPRVVARESSQPYVVARESSQPRVVARESSQPRVVALGSSQPTVEAWGSSQPTVEAWENSQPTVEARESSQPRVVALGSSQPTVEAWDSSQPTVEAWESSQPHVVAWGSSQPRVEALESSQPRVVARGFSMLQLKGAGIAAKASATAAINLWRGAKCDGGRQQNCEISTPEQWCEYQGVPIDDGKVVLFKAVDDSYQSEHGGDYTPGSITKAHDWNTTTECGAGLHASPSPRHTHEFVTNPKRYVAVTANVADLVFFWEGEYPNKVKFPETVAPAYEVDIDGNPVAARVA